MRYVWIIVVGIILAGVIVVMSAERSPRIESGSTAPAAQSLDEPITSTSYRIRKDDTLASIAQRRWGNARLWRRIVEANPGLGEEETIQVGDTISLPDLDDFTSSEALVADLDSGRKERETEDEANDSSKRTEELGPGLKLGLDRSILHATVEPGHVTRTDDGVLLADGTHRIEGAGTREDPYRLDWDLLASAGRTYRPSLNERKIPQWIAMLDGTWIEISGYVAFPLPQDTSEMIVMLNQWDGCCIGLPPIVSHLVGRVCSRRSAIYAEGAECCSRVS